MHLGIPANAGSFSYHPANRCIYCDAKEYSGGQDRDFGEEHIVPAGLGALAVLPSASCNKHEGITSSIESRLFQRLFDPTRKRLEVLVKRPLLKNKFPVFRMVDGESIRQNLPIGDHPTVLFLPKLGSPGILSGRPRWMHGVTGVFLANINAHEDVLKKSKINSFSTPFVDTVTLAQFLAKIGHAYASAEVLRENFDPILIDYIEQNTRNLDNEDFRYQFWGGDASDLPPTPFLHELGLGLTRRLSDVFLVARIRLFAYLGAPAYFVVVGTVSEDKMTAVTARLSQNNSRTHAQ